MTKPIEFLNMSGVDIQKKNKKCRFLNEYISGTSTIISSELSLNEFFYPPAISILSNGSAVLFVDCIAGDSCAHVKIKAGDDPEIYANIGLRIENISTDKNKQQKIINAFSHLTELCGGKKHVSKDLF